MVFIPVDKEPVRYSGDIEIIHINITNEVLCGLMNKSGCELVEATYRSSTSSKYVSMKVGVIP